MEALQILVNPGTEILECIARIGCNFSRCLVALELLFNKKLSKGQSIGFLTDRTEFGGRGKGVLIQ